MHFIGAGPGAADLVTVRAARIIASAPVCLYAGALVPRELLDTAPPGARLVDTADLDLDRITAELVAAHEAGLDVARLHSGDPSIYSAMAEQMRRLDAAGVPYEVVPGVPAFAAAAASLKRELTVPGVGQTVVLTRTSARSTPMPPGEQLAAYAATGATLVLHLAVQRIAELAPELAEHYGDDVVGDARGVQPAHLLGHRAVDRRVAGVQPRHVVAGLVRRDQLERDRVEVEVGGVDQPGVGRGGVEQLAGHQRTGVQADRRRRDEPRGPQRDQVRRPGPRADEEDRHAVPPVVPAETAGFPTLQMVTGIADLQPV